MPTISANIKQFREEKQNKQKIPKQNNKTLTFISLDEQNLK